MTYCSASCPTDCEESCERKTRQWPHECAGRICITCAGQRGTVSDAELERALGHRVTDEQITEWRAWADLRDSTPETLEDAHNLVALLESERARADDLREELARERERADNERRRADHILIGTEAEARQLTEARAWAAWFAAEAEWLDNDVSVIVERDQAQAALDRVKALHRPVMRRWSSEQPIYERQLCGGCGELWPCTTTQAVDRG